MKKKIPLGDVGKFVLLVIIIGFQFLRLYRNARGKKEKKERDDTKSSCVHDLIHSNTFILNFTFMNKKRKK